MENEAASDLSRLASLLKSKPEKVMLFIEGEVPRYDISAGNFIIFEYLKIFARNGYRVIFWPHDRKRPEPYSNELEQMGVQVVSGQLSFQDFIEEFGGFLDVAILCRPDISACYIDPVKANASARIIYFAHDLHFLRERRSALARASAAEAIQALMTEAAELAVMRKAEASLFFNRSEIGVVAREAPEVKATLIPWIQGLNDRGRLPFADRRGLVFLGGFQHQPNADAVTWFHDAVYPLIKNEIHNIGVKVIGGHVPAEIMELDCEDFRVLGHVSSLDEPLQQARIFIAPLRFGAGFKGKIAMAQSYGLPVVTTGIGAEGMELKNGETALIAGNAAGFARQVCRLYRDEELWQQISGNSINYVKKMFSPEKAGGVIMPVIEGAAAAGSGAQTGGEPASKIEPGSDLDLVLNSFDILSRIYSRSREEVAQLNDFIQGLRQHIEQLGGEIKNRSDEIESIYTSRSWKIAVNLRSIRRLFIFTDKQ